MIGTTLVVIVIVVLALAVLLGLLEASGGYMGDGSMVPGLLLFGGGLCVLLILVALLTGEWVLTTGG